MKLDETLTEIRKRVRKPRRSEVERAIKVTAATVSAIWVVLRLKRELYGPGGTKLSRYDREVDKVWRRDRND